MGILLGRQIIYDAYCNHKEALKNVISNAGNTPWDDNKISDIAKKIIEINKQDYNEVDVKAFLMWKIEKPKFEEQDQFYFLQEIFDKIKEEKFLSFENKNARNRKKRENLESEFAKHPNILRTTEALIQRDKNRKADFVQKKQLIKKNVSDGIIKNWMYKIEKVNEFIQKLNDANIEKEEDILLRNQLLEIIQGIKNNDLDSVNNADFNLFSDARIQNFVGKENADFFSCMGKISNDSLMKKKQQQLNNAQDILNCDKDIVANQRELAKIKILEQRIPLPIEQNAALDQNAAPEQKLVQEPEQKQVPEQKLVQEPEQKQVHEQKLNPVLEPEQKQAPKQKLVHEQKLNPAQEPEQNLPLGRINSKNVMNEDKNAEPKGLKKLLRILAKPFIFLREFFKRCFKSFFNHKKREF